MKTLLVGINSKYIHPNMAIRLLKANTNYDCDFVEFNIKDKISDIYDYIINNNFEFVGFSVYIWNVEMVKEILILLKDKNIIIMLGGPEVSYNHQYYFDNNLCDYIIKNEGEEAFNLLLRYYNDKDISLTSIPNLYYKSGYTFDKLVDIDNIKLPYYLLDDVKNKIVYLETSRGCPYHCSYCMASLDNKLRFFDINKIKAAILELNNKDAKIFKLLDRTFNAHKKNFIELIDFIILNHKEGQSYQFEITGDLLSLELIDYINQRAPKNLFRFEIGIQSTNILANKAVRRIQDNNKLFLNIKRIQEAKIIDLHLDLIAGLPYEDYNSFINTFNEVISLNPKELQLGFLKLLHGTKLKEEVNLYDYKYKEQAPYELISNKFMSIDDINKIHLAEDAFETFYNSMILPNTNTYLIHHYFNMYNIYYELGNLNYRGKSLEERYLIFNNYFKNYSDYDKIHELIILDYLNYYKVKPKAWWDERLQVKNKKNIIKMLVENKKISYNIVEVYKYSLIVYLKDIIILALYFPTKREIICIERENLNVL